MRVWIRCTAVPACAALLAAVAAAAGGGAQEDLEADLARIEAAEGIASEALIEPLAGLARIHAAHDRHDLAIGYWDRAIAVLRRAEGLFSPRQLPLLEGLDASCLAVGEPRAALEVRRYALAIVERAYGEDDPRTLPAIAALIALYEQLAEHEQVRRQYEHMRRVGLREGGQANPTVVRALLGIGRSHLRQFVEEPTSVHPHWIRDPVSGEAIPQMSLEPFQSPRPDRAGRKSTAEALALLRRVDDPPAALLASALIDTGDWQVVLQRPQDAMAHYAEASRLYARFLPDEADPLAMPRLVLYRAPKPSRRSELPPAARLEMQTARFRLTVDAEGRPRDIVLEESTTSERRVDLLRRSLESARYSPRFEGGRPVVTGDVVFVGSWEALAGETEES